MRSQMEGPEPVAGTSRSGDSAAESMGWQFASWLDTFFHSESPPGKEVPQEGIDRTAEGVSITNEVRLCTSPVSVSS